MVSLGKVTLHGEFVLWSQGTVGRGPQCEAEKVFWGQKMVCEDCTPRKCLWKADRSEQVWCGDMSVGLCSTGQKLKWFALQCCAMSS